MKTIPINLTGKKIGKNLRLMHISDLHFNKIDLEKVTAFKSDLSEFKPSIIVITGDLIHSPWSISNFDKAKEFVNYLEQKTGKVIIALGNHETLGSMSSKKFVEKFSIDQVCCYFLKFGKNNGVASSFLTEWPEKKNAKKNSGSF